MTLDVIVAARRRTRRAGIVAVVVGMGLIAAAALAATYATTHPDTQLGDTPAAALSTAAPDPAGARPTDLLPADVLWVQLAGVDLPVSVATGPAMTVGGLARGFAHSRSGAVVAVLHLLVRTTAQVGPTVFEPTLARQVVGQHALAMRQAVGEDYRRLAARKGVVYGQPLGDLPAAVAGVRVDEANDTQVTVSVLTTAVDAAGVTRYAATTVTVVWTDEDWRLLAPPQGRWDDLLRIVDVADTGGFVPLRGR